MVEQAGMAFYDFSGVFFYFDVVALSKYKLRMVKREITGSK